MPTGRDLLPQEDELAALEQLTLERLTLEQFALEQLTLRRCRQLEKKCAELEARLRERRIWRLGELHQRIDELVPADARNHFRELVTALHSIARDSGLDCLPPPEIEVADGDVELSWSNARRKRSIVFYFEDGELVLARLENTRWTESRAPEAASIKSALAWVVLA